MYKLNIILLTALITLLQLMRNIFGFAIITGHCEKNISVKYQVPVTKMRPVTAYTSAENASSMQVYIDYEQRQRWDVVRICCPGYRTIIFGLCEAICDENCPPHSHCIEPNKCQCSRGYVASHYTNKEQKLLCRPNCNGACPEHSHCIAPNVCECRNGYRDVSVWYQTMRCERIPCGPEQHYDLMRRSCVNVEMKMEQLMQKVGERLSHRLLEAISSTAGIINSNTQETVIGIEDASAAPKVKS